MVFNAAYQWKCQPNAEALVLKILEKAIQTNPTIAQLSRDLEKHTSTRLFDWLDHVATNHTPELENELRNSGFIPHITTSTYRVYHQPEAQLPRVVVYDQSAEIVDIAVIVDSIADFLMARNQSAFIEGSPYSGYRRSCVASEHQVSLWIVERRGHLAMEPVYEDPGYLERYFEAQEIWKCRPRRLSDDDDELSNAIYLAQEIVNMLGSDSAACVILECEREYWQGKNTAAQIQKNRQDRLGMGWANHDHHTFRSSRQNFMYLVRLFEVLGFHCRERFYAGIEARWGAQVMENPNCRLVLFLDVDLDGDEISVDFAHQPLPMLNSLGTIGLWCALHGDSILKSGMHHLEAQFLFDELKKDLSHSGVGMMDPFSSFPYLKQAFTQGEPWLVDPSRVESLFNAELITREQADKFLAYGAVGSHMENLQRREGYKGFNQKNVSQIIKKTDPRSA